jgi:hypothetical protein
LRRRRRAGEREEQGEGGEMFQGGRRAQTSKETICFMMKTPVLIQASPP